MHLSSATVGNFNLYTIETGRFRLDGGAMFGVVPKTLWSKKIDVDKNNRIPMAARCLLIESEASNRCYLVDTGCGTKFNEKMSDIYQIDFKHSDLITSLEYHGFEPADITDVIFTHLHFDHCGGTTFYMHEGKIAHRFKNATYHVTESHWQTATKPNDREKASFLADNIKPLKKSGRLHLVGDNYKYENNLYTVPVNGHTWGQQLPKINNGSRSLLFAGDLLPTHVHLPLPWVMGYDMAPRQTLQEKKAYLKQAASENWYIYLEHDAEQEIIQITTEEKKFTTSFTGTLDDL